ncbi:MAG TPA: EAL domain-containing protein [Vicinamibacteria bacterium]|nr:EAL domain-containing protein [Vicinamibacteria bacterium]
MHRQLRRRGERDARLRLLVEQLPAIVWSTDLELRVTSSLGGGLKGLRLRPHPLAEMSLSEYFQVDPEDDRVPRAHRRALAGETVEFQLEWRGRHFEAHLEPLHDATGVLCGTIGVALDVTARRQAEEQLHHAAQHDPLTDLPNRALFLGRLDGLIERTRRDPRQRFAVLLMDLDRFKTITDSLGHLVGDRLLVAVARRLEACLRRGEILVRFGGDEFTLLIEDVRDARQATRLAERIHAALLAPFVVDGNEVVMSASIGIVLGGAGHVRPEALLRDADTAMYRAKALGRGRHQLFDEAMHREAVDVLNLEMDMRRGLARGEFRLYYQPIVSIETGEVRAVEALLRWQHPERGLLLPESFVPLAEENGLILPLGSWVLRESCRQLGAWDGEGADRPLGLTVNLSPRQLSKRDFLDEVSGTVEECGLESRRITLEITESVIMDDAVMAAGLLTRMRDREMEVSIDDFGKGHSSLSQLHRMPFDILKIDRSFVSAMGLRAGNREIVRTIVELGHNLDMRVVAEGVETPEQLAVLRAMGCDDAQGYLFSPPVPPTAVGPLVRN